MGAATRAPDEYPEWGHWTYESHMADIRDLWARARPQLRKNMTDAERVEQTLQAMFLAFDRGDKQAGRKLALEITRMGVESWR